MYQTRRTMILNDIVKVICINPSFEVIDDIIDIIQKLINVQIHQVIIIGSIYFNEGSKIKTSFEISTIKYELRMLLHTKRVNDNWTSEVYSRYGNHLYSWWYQTRKDTSARYSCLPHTLIENEIYILAYIRIE